MLGVEVVLSLLACLLQEKKVRWHQYTDLVAANTSYWQSTN